MQKPGNNVKSAAVNQASKSMIKKPELFERGRQKVRLLQQAYPTADIRLSLQRERARSDRTGEVFALLVVECEGGGRPYTLLHNLWSMIYRRIRCTDDMGWLDSKSIAIVLPGTPPEGAWRLAEDIRKRMDSSLLSLNCKVYFYPVRNHADGNHAMQASAEFGRT